MHCDVIVVGGGIVGLSAAIAIKLRGFSVVVVDRGSMTFDASAICRRVYAINSASEELLKSLGVWSQIASSQISPYQHMHVWDSESLAAIDFDARMLGTDKLGVIIEETVIKRSLLDKIIALNISVLTDTKVEKIESHSNHISVVAGEHPMTAQLLIVADGARSETRDLLNVPLTSWSYHQRAIVATVRTEKPHQKTAYQVFLKEGPLAFLPLSDPNESSIVWSTSVHNAERLMALSDTLFRDELQQSFAATLGTLSLITKRHEFPLQMRHVKQYSGLRWVLMGDAAHTVHPLAGLGLNLGLADVSSWLACLKDNKDLIWSSRASGAYQRQRKYALWQVIALMEGLNTLFTSSFLPVVALRGLGLRVCNRLSPLKRLLMEHAAGVRVAILSNL